MWLHEGVKLNKELQNHYDKLIVLNEQILKELDRGNTMMTVSQFNGYLTKLATDLEDENLSIFVKGYSHRLQHFMSLKSLIDNSKIEVISPEWKRKTAMLFIVTLACSAFLAFLIESMQNYKGRIK